MSTITQIRQTVEEITSLKLITENYSEIASNKLKRIRTGIERNRNFLSEIAGMYFIIKLVAQSKNLKAKKGQKDPHAPKKILSILLTSNYRFYGNLEYDLVQFFLQNIKRFQTDVLVVGKIGIDYLKAKKTLSFTPLVPTSDLPTAEALKQIMQFILPYDQVLVYHSRFQSVLNQTPFIRDIKETIVPQRIPKKAIDYIFEPEIHTMLTFFDTQISTLLLEQTFLEAELARTASRLVAMNQAEERANEFLDKQQRELAGKIRSIYNIKLLETIATTFHARRQNL